MEPSIETQPTKIPNTSFQILPFGQLDAGFDLKALSIISVIDSLKNEVQTRTEKYDRLFKLLIEVFYPPISR